MEQIQGKNKKYNALKLLSSCSVVFDSSATPWTIARQSLLCMGFPRQENWSGLPSLLPGSLPNPGIEPRYPALTGKFFTTEPPGKPLTHSYLWAINLQQRRQQHTTGKRQSLQQVLGKLDSYM